MHTSRLFGSVHLSSNDSCLGLPVVQWLRLHDPNAESLDWILGRGTRSHMQQLKIPHAATKILPFPPGQVPLLPPGQVPSPSAPTRSGPPPLLPPGQDRTLRPCFHHETGSRPQWTRSPAPGQHQAAHVLLLFPSFHAAHPLLLLRTREVSQ